MAWFSSEFISFFSELAENNHKEWFDANRSRYENFVKVPFKAFVGELLLRLRQHDPHLLPDVAQAMFRINRDIRFSKDKAPYKLHMGALLGRYGRKNLEYPAFYFELRADAIMFASGAYSPGKEYIERIRYHIAEHPHDFMEVLEDKSFVAKYGKLKGLQNKKVPADLKEAFLKQPYIANKEFYCMSEIPSVSITSEDLMDVVEAYFLSALPLNRFLQEAWE